MFRTTNELNATEEGDAAGQQHGEGAKLESTVLAGGGSCCIPSAEGPTVALVVDVVEEAIVRDEERVRLEWTL